MVAFTLGQVVGGLSLLPEIAKGVETVFGLAQDFLGGGTKPQTAVSNVSGGLGTQLRGGGIAPVQAGTSVGPIIEAAGQVLTALPPVITAITGARVGQPLPQTGFGSPFGQTGLAMPAANGVRTMTRKQFILATARAANPGATAKKILRSARECGIELSAATFGLNVLDVCFLIAQPPTRRSRGISAADLRRTRSTVRKVHNIEADFREWCKTPVRRRRSK